MAPRSRAAWVAVAVFGAGVLLRVAMLVAYRPAFLGDPDAGVYIDAAHRGLFSDVYEPAGYSLLIRALHAISPHLTVLIGAQHMLGVATAALWFLAVRRVTGSTPLALIPAVIVLLDGFGLWVEHSPISEALFEFLVAGSIYLALRSEGRARRLLAGSGVVMACAGVVRPVALVLVLVIAAWAAWAGGGNGLSRVLSALAPIAPAVALVAVYVLVQSLDTGFVGLTPDSGRLLYARVAPFADCSKFTPPAGTRALCESTPSSRRGSPNQYATGFPDRAIRLTVSRGSISPAWRVFGPPPAGNGKLAAFALAVVIHQPLQYISTVAGDFHYYWTDDHRGFITRDEQVDPNVERAVTSYYATGAGVHSTGLSVLRSYSESVQLRGVAMILLLVAPLTLLAVEDRRARRAGALLACSGWLLPLAADATLSTDPRYMLPAYGPLAAAAAIGLGSERIRGGVSTGAGRVRAKISSGRVRSA